jgi:hypothetical protein
MLKKFSTKGVGLEAEFGFVVAGLCDVERIERRVGVGRRVE